MGVIEGISTWVAQKLDLLCCLRNCFNNTGTIASDDRRKMLAIIVIALSIGWMAICILIPHTIVIFSVPTIPILWFWIFNFMVFAVDGLVIGYCFTGRWLGILINERKLMSISRVQVALWTLLVLSVLFTIFVIRFRSGVQDPINVGIDLHLWAVLGISLGSFAGKTAIMGRKSARNIPLNIMRDNTTTSLMDMFRCDEVQSKDVADIGKVQMFFFTLITIIPYTFAIWMMFVQTGIGSITGLPPLTDAFVAILGISHAGMLGNSAVKQTLK
jgi:hypothetical protein